MSQAQTPTPEQFVAELIKRFTKGIAVQIEEAKAKYPEWIVPELKAMLKYSAKRTLPKTQLTRLDVSHHNIVQLVQELQTQLPGFKFEMDILKKDTHKTSEIPGTLRRESFSSDLSDAFEWAKLHGSFRVITIRIWIPTLDQK